MRNRDGGTGYEADVGGLTDELTQELLKELLTAGRIDEDTYETFKTKIQRLDNTINESNKNHIRLASRNEQLKHRLTAENVQLASATQVKADNTQISRDLTAVSKKARDEQFALTEKESSLADTLQQLNADLAMKKDELKNRLNRMEDAIREEERYFQKEIEDILAETQTTTEKIFQMKHKGVEVENTKKQFQKTLAELAEEHEKLVSEYNKIKDDPGRQDSKIKTASDTLQTANKTLRETEDEIKEKEKILNAEKATIEGVRRKIAEVVKVSQAEDKKLEELTKNRMNLEVEKAERTDDKTGLLMDKAAKEDMLKALHKEFRNKLESNNKTKVEVDKLKKEIRALENDRNKQSNAIREDEMALAKMVKEKAEVRSKKEKLVSTIRGLQIEQKLLIDKKDILKNEGEKVLSEVRKHEMSIEEQKKKLLDLKATEADGLKNIKSLTTFREITARKASGANAEVRATKEELKIKELQMLDLTKRQQEIEFKLNSFKTLYEEVKSARNKYVNEIQSSSQQLAELKQRIKIAQNELEISKNESVEKEKSLLKLMGSTKKQIHERDKKRAKLNKSEFEKQKLIEQGNQQANQIAKLNMITLSLQGDMLEIRKHYESACESRNYMGVQLIDRNDELCILYEKTNVQESIIKNGEAEIAKVEDEIRMIQIEIKEVERRIEASRKKAPEIPKLASKVVQLNQELQAELAKEEKLSEELENIENSDRWREIKGEEPDPEALKAKIQVLEEKLNSKKESLLEKELILDEVTNISENLRKQSIESRRPTLELTSKVNELQARLKATTRKMMATISELSMFQANVIKLESEKTELYNYLDSIRDRAQKGLPPTDESEIEFLKILRDKKRYLEMREEKLEMEMVRNSMAPFTINSTAVERFNAYVDELGLPRPYGFFRPFQPSQLGANLRHFKRPEPREIQI